MKRGWAWWVLALAVAVALGAGYYTAGRRAEAVDQAVLFEAVRSWLAEANVPRQDMPKEIISVKPLGPDRYLVHMQMVVGEGWFEVWRSAEGWQVKGAPPPS
ncbi:MAG: hypothetical protein ACOY94_15100 [Bacillota bacterium]